MAAPGWAAEVRRAALRRLQTGALPCEQQQMCEGVEFKGAFRRLLPDAVCGDIGATRLGVV